MITREKLIAAGPAKLADMLLSLYQGNTYIHNQLDILFAGLDEDPQGMVSKLRKEIATLELATEFVDYYESNAFAERIDQLRLRIANDLLEKSPQLALDLMLTFLDVANNTIERTDDSNGVVGDVFTQACEDLANICKHMQMSLDDLVDLVFTRCISDEYGIYDMLITNFREILQETGLQKLQKKFEQALNSSSNYRIKRALGEIADCRKDVDAYIQACMLTDQPSVRQQLDIIERLIKHSRNQEALQWLDSIVLLDNYHWKQDWYTLKIQALTAHGDHEQAQKIRLAWFEEALSSTLYREILAHADPTFKERFRKEAIQKAFQDTYAQFGLRFLTDLQELEEAAKLVRLKVDVLDGDLYYSLRPAAELLKDPDPLAATILYRKMIQSNLERAKSKYYNYAAQDLVTCNILSSRITDWENLTPHNLYMSTLEQKHKRKIRFWAEYQSAIQSQTTKFKPKSIPD